MATDDQIYRQLESMSKGIGKMGEYLAAMARASGARIDGRGVLPGEADTGRGRSGGVLRASKDAEKAAESYDKASKDFLQAAKGMKNIRTSFNKWNEALGKSGGYLTGLDADFRNFGGNIYSIGQQAKKIVDGMGRYSAEMAKATKAQSLLYANQLRQLTDMKDFEQAAAYEKLSEALENLTDGQKKALGVLDEATGKLRTDLNFEELAHARAALGNVMGDIAENLKGTDFKSLKQMAALGGEAVLGRSSTLPGGVVNANIEAVTKIAAQLEKAGLHTGGMKILDKNGNIKKGASTMIRGRPEEFLKQLMDAFERLEASTNKTDRAVDALSTPIGKLATALSTAEGRLGLFNKGMAYFLTTAALKKGADGLRALYKEVSDFNIAQVPATFADTYKAAVQMGVGFGEATKILQENKRMLAIYGPDQFRTALGGFKDTFKQFGYTMAQGAEIIGPAVEQAITSGVNTKDANALNNFMKDTMTSFQNLAGVVNITAVEYMKMNRDMLRSEGTFETLMGMDQDRRQAYAKDLIQQRDRYAIQGLELDQARRLVETQQQQQRDKVSNRFSEAAKLLQQAQLNGLGAQQSTEAYRLALKGVRTKDENARLTELLGASAQGFEQRRLNAYGPNGDSASGYLVDVQGENLALSGPLAQMQKDALALRSAQQGGADATGTAARASGLAKGNEAIATFGNAINSISTVMNSVLLGAVTGTAISFIALIKQARMLSGAFGAMGKASGLSGSVPGASMPGKGGGGWKGLGKGLGGGLLGLGATLGAGYAADALTASGSPKAGAAMDILGGTAGWALTGASIGSVIPGIGTIAGGLIGGGAGLAKGLYDNWGTFATPSGDVIKRPQLDQNDVPGSINTQGPGLVAVKDITVADQLVALNNLTNQMVELLTKISEKEGTTVLPSLQKSASVAAGRVTPAYTFTTGRPA